MAQSTIQQELNRGQSEPLLLIEKKLIGWSLGIGSCFSSSWRCLIISCPRHSEEFSRAFAGKALHGSRERHAIAG